MRGKISTQPCRAEADGEEMRAPAPILVVLLAASCGPTRPTLDAPDDSGRDSIETGGDSWGVRLLSDVRAPDEPDAPKGMPNSPVRDAGERASAADAPANDAEASPDDQAPMALCGNGIVEGDEECDDGAGNDDTLGFCLSTCRLHRCEDGGVCFCGDGAVRPGIEECDDGNQSSFDACSNQCKAAADHLLITEVVTRPGSAEMIEIMNPTAGSISLSDYVVSDSHLYYKVASGTFTTASGSDFAARFPEGATIEPGQYRVVALANASGGSSSFVAVYGKLPDFEMRPTANGATDDPSVPDMRSAQATSSSIGASASLTDGGEPIILFRYGSALVSDVDYLFYGAPSTSNPVVDKTGITIGDLAYAPDTRAAEQHAIGAPGESGSIHRCFYAETGEVRTAGNGLTGHDETSEDPRSTFALGTATSERTPGSSPPPSVCQ
jgi:cysteine-rich repeat protein